MRFKLCHRQIPLSHRQCMHLVVSQADRYIAAKKVRRSQSIHARPRNTGTQPWLPLLSPESRQMPKSRRHRVCGTPSESAVHVNAAGAHVGVQRSDKRGQGLHGRLHVEKSRPVLVGHGGHHRLLDREVGEGKELPTEEGALCLRHRQDRGAVLV